MISKCDIIFDEDCRYISEWDIVGNVFSRCINEDLYTNECSEYGCELNSAGSTFTRSIQGKFKSITFQYTTVNVNYGVCFVEYSINNGNNWETLEELDQWIDNQRISSTHGIIYDFTGVSEILIRFRNSNADICTFNNIYFRGLIANDTANPTNTPTNNPTVNPTISPSVIPTTNPTSFPTINPTINPTNTPINSPTSTPTVNPSASPSISSTSSPSLNPILKETVKPTITPSVTPTTNPTPPSLTNTTTLQPTPNPLLDPKSNHSTSAPSHSTTNPYQTGSNNSQTNSATMKLIVFISILAVGCCLAICMCAVFITWSIIKSLQKGPQFAMQMASDSAETNSTISKSSMNIPENMSPAWISDEAEQVNVEIGLPANIPEITDGGIPDYMQDKEGSLDDSYKIGDTIQFDSSVITQKPPTRPFQGEISADISELNIKSNITAETTL